MNIVIFGANGGVGTHLVEQALSAGHNVTAAVRQPQALRIRNERLTVVQCDAYDEDAVEQATIDQEAVLCALGAPKAKEIRLYSKSLRNIVRAMDWNGVSRLIYLSNFGVLDEKAADHVTKVLLLIARSAIRPTLDDHKRALEYVAEHAYQWTAVRPTLLTNGSARGKYRISEHDIPEGGWRISRADVAHFMLRQLNEDRFINGSPCISY